MLQQRGGWAAGQIELFDAAFALYWERSSSLAARVPFWPPPRLRHVSIVLDPDRVRPYVQLLNVSSWTLYETDFDPDGSTAEFAAYLFVHGDRMSQTGEVTRAAVLAAPYWFDRSDAECAQFALGAQRSSRPDAAGFRALAEALPWMRQLSHETLRPPPLLAAYRSIPESGLLVRRDLEAAPAALVQRWEAAARSAVNRFRARQPASDSRESRRLCEWLAETRPPLLICGQRGRILWDPECPDRIAALRDELRAATAPALADIRADLEIVWRRTRAFHAALRNPHALPRPHAAMEQRGYVYLHSPRGLIAYNLHEPGLERLESPAIPYARAMLAARTVHEWAHLAVDAGWVPMQLRPEEFAAAAAALAAELDAVVKRAPAAIRSSTEADLRELLVSSSPPDRGGLLELTRGLAPSVGLSLARIILRRLPDFQANLLAQSFLDPAERETYVRHNVRELRSQFPPQRRWRMLARYLYEYQYLRFSAVEEREEFFLRSTWFDADFIHSGILDRAGFRRLAAAVGRLGDAFAVAEEHFVFAQPD